MTIAKNRWITKKNIAVAVALLLLASLVGAVFQPGWSIFQSNNKPLFSTYESDSVKNCSKGAPKAYCICIENYLFENYSIEELNNLTSEEVRNAGYACITEDQERTATINKCGADGVSKQECLCIFDYFAERTTLAQRLDREYMRTEQAT
ncbi:MAG TPA: hypothetical protein VI953_05115 [Candidatus Paceibacterota bacterium]